MRIYAIKDVKIGFNSPFVQYSENVAKRTFMAAITDERGAYYKYPEDIELWYLGDFDDETGIIRGCDPQYIMGGKDICTTQHT